MHGEVLNRAQRSQIYVLPLELSGISGARDNSGSEVPNAVNRVLCSTTAKQKAGSLTNHFVASRLQRVIQVEPVDVDARSHCALLPGHAEGRLFPMAFAPSPVPGGVINNVTINTH